MKLSDEIIVSVCMITYNHENYIEQAINGVLMQDCNFQIELIIANDCSPDNTDYIVKKIIKNHPKANLINYTKHENNLGMIPNFHWVLEKCTGKYIAICEGDDYWIDPYKLQKQVDFLEANPDYGMVHTNYNILYQETGKISKRDITKIPSGDVYEEYLQNAIIGTATTLFRRNYIEKLFEFYIQVNRTWKMGDRILWQIIASQAKIKYLDEVTTIYRRHNTSVTNFENIQDDFEFFKDSYNIRFHFINNIRSINDQTLNEIKRIYFKRHLYFEFKLNSEDTIEDTFGELKKYGVTLTDIFRYFSLKNKYFKIFTKLIFR